MAGEAHRLIPKVDKSTMEDPRMHLVLTCDFDTYAKYRMFKKLPGTMCTRLLMEHQMVVYHTPVTAKIILVQPGYKDTYLFRTGAVTRWVQRANKMDVKFSATEEFYFPLEGGLLL